MDYQSGHVMTLANSIIGVSILAMPYCFKQCGIVLSTVILLISSIISRLACHFLLKSAIIARRKTFEFLAFHIFGALGKFAIEIGIIGLLLGTCVAFFVVMGDLGPEIIAEITEARSNSTMRTSILIALALFCVLPLGLLRNIDSLDGVSKATIGFYCCLVLKIIIEALPHLFTGDWISHVYLWRPAGILQCLPIFSMALFCQTQLFEIYQAIPNVSLDKMNNLIRVAVNICTWVYIFVGVFGYIAFFQKPFTGNILLSFNPSIVSDVMKIGFVLSLAFSFPLVIFPCRASLYSLLYKETSYTLHEGIANYISEGKFKCLTFLIVLVSLIIGIMIPNIELVLGLIGSTIGVMICVLFPVTCFICISPKNTNERLLAQIMLFVGIIVMVLGTYANLYAFEEATLNIATQKSLDIPNNGPGDKFDATIKAVLLKLEKDNIKIAPTTHQIPAVVVNEAEDPVENNNNVKEIRHEPPQPEEPVENVISIKPVVKDDIKINDKPIQEQFEKDKDKIVLENDVIKDKQLPFIEQQHPNVNEDINQKAKEIEKHSNDNILKDVEFKNVKNINDTKKNDEVDIEAIKKEETELKEQEKEKAKEDNDKNKILIETIKKQNEEIVEQQKKLIEVIQNQQLKDSVKMNEEKLKAVKQIESIARKAIESISGQEKKVEIPSNNNNNNNNAATDKRDDNEKSNLKLNSSRIVEQEEKTKLTQNQINNMVPLPIARNQINNFTNDFRNEDLVKDIKKTNGNNSKINLSKLEESKNGDDVKQLENNQHNDNVEKLVEKIDEKNQTVQKNVNHDAGDDNVIRREILSDSEHRVKRDTNELNKISTNQNSSSLRVCEELKSTEKPIIKMLCKLTEPQLVDVDVKQLDTEKNPVDVIPQKRDLKQVDKE